MSGGFTPSLRQSEVDVTGKASWLASENYTVKRSGITVDSTKVAADANGNKIVAGGTFMAQDPATSKYAPVAADAATAIDPNTSGFLFPDGINLADGDVICGLMIQGSVLGARVTPNPLPAVALTAIAGRIIVQ